MNESEPLIWGPYSLPRSSGTLHFLATGTTGSGKTTLIDNLMRSVFSHSSYRLSALIYDAKQDAFPKLFALDLARRIRIMHPFDLRCSPWDLAADIDDPISARQFAQILIPETSVKNDSSFFEDACRDIVAVVVEVFSLCVPNRDWTLRDLLIALLYEDKLEMILKFDRTRDDSPFPPAKRIWQSYFDERTTDDRTRGNIRSTLNAKLSVFEPVAAAWAKSPNDAFSLKKWQEDNTDEVLILGNDEAGRAAVDPINRALFQRAAELTLAKPDSEKFQTWFFLDEIREAGKLQTLNSLLLKGRSKGACVVLAFQDIEGIRDVYGTNLANELVANCNNLALLRTNSSSTAEWASQMFGKFMVIEKDQTAGQSGFQVSTSETTRLTERHAVLSGEFLYLPLPSYEEGLTGYFRDSQAKSTDPVRYSIDWSALRTGALPPGFEDKEYYSEETRQMFREWIVGYIPIDRRNLYLLPWTREDYLRLGISDTDGPELPKRPRS